jgi:hypothetical protein
MSIKTDDSPAQLSPDAPYLHDGSFYMMDRCDLWYRPEFDPVFVHYAICVFPNPLESLM